MREDPEFRASLTRLTREATLCRPFASAGEDALQCTACAHLCRIRNGAHGTCQMRLNRAGRLFAPHGYVAGMACDPIEKKPFFHLLPGRDALSFGMLGCNLHCEFCQNWNTSQTLRDPRAIARPQRCTAEDIVTAAAGRGAPVVASTYNEPLVTSEWAGEVFALAKQRGMLTCYVSNGHASVEVLQYLAPVLDAMNVDLKCFTDQGYARLGGRLEPVLDTIRWLWARGKWVEVITLVVPGFNDSDAELTQIAEFLASVSPDIPWHVTAYHADYHMSQGVARTPMERLATAIAIGGKVGIRFVYGGNVHGLGSCEDTTCHCCGTLLIERRGFALRTMRVAQGACPGCGSSIPGRWAPGTEGLGR